MPSPVHILAVNDSAEILALFEDLLGEEGYRVTTQTHVAKDLEEIAQLAPDLMILDYMWAREDTGWALLQMLRLDPRTAHIPIILCTGAVREVTELNAHLKEMGVTVVLKPFDLEHLLREIARLLDEVTPAAEREG